MNRIAYTLPDHITRDPLPGRSLWIVLVSRARAAELIEALRRMPVAVTGDVEVRDDETRVILDQPEACQKTIRDLCWKYGALVEWCASIDMIGAWRSLARASEVL